MWQLSSRANPDRYSTTHISDSKSNLNGKSTVDQVRAYHQIPVWERNIEKNCYYYTIRLVWISENDSWIKKRCAQSCQQFMHSVIRNLDFCIVYIDDLLRTIVMINIYKNVSKFGIVINSEKKVSFLATTLQS